MTVECSSCGASYNISDDKVRGRRVRVRCKSCGDAIVVDGHALPTEDATQVYSADAYSGDATQVYSPDATQVYSPGFNPSAYGESGDAATRVMAPGAMGYEGSTEADAFPEVPGGDDWLVNLSDTDQRSMSLDEMASAYGSGLLTDDAFVWREGMAGWKPLLEVGEIRDALGGREEATQVVRPIDLRAAKPRAAAAPVAYAAPVAPPRARTAAEPVQSVEYGAYEQPAAHARPPAPPRHKPAPVVPPPRAPPVQARVRERHRADLFGEVDATGGEAELLKNRSMPLDSYDAPGTGARNENSVLFSLNALKAGHHGPQGAPPRLAAAPPTAADILGMTAGGAVPGLGSLDTTSALLAAPSFDAPVERQSTIPPRARMETAPVRSRNTKKSGGWMLPAVGLAGLCVAGAAAFVFRDRFLPGNDADLPAAAAPALVAPTQAPPAAVAPPPAAVAPPPAAVAPPPAAVAPPPAVASPAPAPTEAPPTGASAPELAAPSTAAAPAPPSGRPGPVVASPALAAPRAPGAGPSPKAAEPSPALPDGKGEKVLLAEEGAAAGATEPEAPAVVLPPFDTASAKAALEAASAGAGSCKKPDGPTGRGKVQVTFSPKSGRATSANVVEGAFGGTPVGGCVAKLFRAAKVPPFSGDPVSVAKSFTIPE